MKPIYAVTLLAVLLAPLCALKAAETSALLPNPERMPAFSWDRVPLYVHIRKDTAFTDEEIKYLSTFPLIAFEKAAELAGYVTMMEDTRKMLGPQKLMLANILRARFPDSGLSYIKALDGSYIEGFEGAVGMSKKDYVAQGIRDFQKAAQQGSIIAYTCALRGNLQDADEAPRPAAGITNPGADSAANPARRDRDPQSRFDYQLAIFLVCAEKYSYFDLKDGYDAKTSKNLDDASGNL